MARCAPSGCARHMTVREDFGPIDDQARRIHTDSCLNNPSGGSTAVRMSRWQLAAAIPALFAFTMLAAFSNIVRAGRQRRSADPRSGPQCLTAGCVCRIHPRAKLSADCVAETDVIRRVENRHATTSKVVQKTLIVGVGGRGECQRNDQRDKRRNDPSLKMCCETVNPEGHVATFPSNRVITAAGIAT